MSTNDLGKIIVRGGIVVIKRGAVLHGLEVYESKVLIDCEAPLNTEMDAVSWFAANTDCKGARIQDSRFETLQQHSQRRAEDVIAVAKIVQPKKSLIARLLGSKS